MVSNIKKNTNAEQPSKIDIKLVKDFEKHAKDYETYASNELKSMADLFDSHVQSTDTAFKIEELLSVISNFQSNPDHNAILEKEGKFSTRVRCAKIGLKSKKSKTSFYLVFDSKTQALVKLWKVRIWMWMHGQNIVWTPLTVIPKTIRVFEND
jgi:hypothetical protein